MPADFYELLGVEEGATREELKRAYRQRARQYHPDVNDDDRANVQFQVLRRAYDVLTDPKERADYDRLGHEAYVRRRMDGTPLGGRPGTAPTTESGAPGDDADADADGDPTAPPDGDTSARAAASESGQWGGATGTPTGAGAGTDAGPRRPDANPGGPRVTPTGDAQSGGASGATTSRYPRSTGRGRRIGLREAWVGAVAATVVYFSGLGQYLLADRAATATAVGALRADPLGTLQGATAGASALPSPGPVAWTALVDAVAVEPAAAVVFPLGAGVLPVVLAWSVARFGRGIAWLYALLAAAPAATLVATALAPVPTVAAVLVGCVLAPALGAGGFLADVGRVVLARSSG